MREGANFFVITIFFLVLCVGYVYSQGGSPFALAGQSINPIAQPPAGSNCGYQDYRCMARQDAIDNHIDPDLFTRQINQESRFNPNVVSTAGAIGIAQILPSTAKGWHVDPWDPTASLSAAAKAMAWYQGHYGSYEKGLACYNAGCSALNSAMSRCGWSWKGCMPSETQRYIAAIMGG